MATPIEKFADPDAVGDDDGSSLANAYTDLDNGIDTEQKNLVTADENFKMSIRNSAGGAFTTGVSFTSTWETDATRFITIEAINGYQTVKGGWDDNRVRISVTDNVAITDSANDNLKIVFLGIQVERVFSASANDNVILLQTADPGSYTVFGRCRIRSRGANGNHRGMLINDADRDVDIFDCIFDFDGANALRYGLFINNGSCNLFNSIIQGAWTDGINIGASGTLVGKNNAIFNNADDIDDSGTTTLDFNSIEDGDGTNNVVAKNNDYADEFNDWPNNDYTLKSDGNLFQGGVNAPDASLYTTDMDGDSFLNPYSIGVDEFIAAGGTNPLFFGIGAGIMNGVF